MNRSSSTPTRDGRPPYNLTTWTRFSYPEGEDLWKVVDDEESPRGKLWNEGTRALITSPGWMGSAIGRIIERPEEVLIVTTWESKDALMAFEESPSFLKYQEIISLFGAPSPPELAEFLVHGRNPAPKYNDLLSIRTSYFPPQVKQTTEGISIRGLAIAPTGRYNKRRAATFRRWQNWHEKEQEYKGQKVACLISVNWWDSWDAREDFLQNHKPYLSNKQVAPDGTEYEKVGESMLPVELWDHNLREAGAIGWKDELVHLLWLPSGKWYFEWSYKKGLNISDEDYDEMMAQSRKDPKNWLLPQG